MPEPDFETFPNPPVIEAIVDFDVERRADAPEIASVLDRAKAAIGDNYGEHKTEYVRTMRIGLVAERDEAPSPAEIRGYLFLANDGEQAVQFRRDGFTFNKLKPYKSLNAHLPDIQRSWNIYRGIADPSRVKRIGLRFVNKIALPDGDMTRWFKAPPASPPGSQFKLVGFLDQHKLLDSRSGLLTSVVMHQQPPDGGNSIVILDISVSKPVTLMPDSEDIWTGLVEARNVKNAVFLGMVTEQCLTLFR